MGSRLSHHSWLLLEKGIRLSGPKLGRPSKNNAKIEKAKIKQDEGERNLIERRFGLGVVNYTIP
jgi:IS5 family transposase